MQTVVVYFRLATVLKQICQVNFTGSNAYTARTDSRSTSANYGHIFPDGIRIRQALYNTTGFSYGSSTHSATEGHSNCGKSGLTSGCYAATYRHRYSTRDRYAKGHNEAPNRIRAS